MEGPPSQGPLGPRGRPRQPETIMGTNETVTPEELEARVHHELAIMQASSNTEEVIASSEEVERLVRRAARTIRALEKRAVPKGLYSLGWEDARLRTDIELCMDDRWSWTVFAGDDLVADGYRGTFSEALAAANAARERTDG